MSQSMTIPEHISAPVLRAVSDVFAVATEDILGKSRKDRIVWARQSAIWLLRELTPGRVTCLDLAALFELNHTTVLYSLKKVAERATNKPSYALLLFDAMQRARGL